MPAYLITTDNDQEEEILQDFAVGRGIKLQWVAVDPETSHDGETIVVNEDAWTIISTSVAEVLTEERPAAAWPKTPLEIWGVKDRRTLIHQAVTRWDHAGDAGIDIPSLLADHDAGRVHNPQNTETTTAA